MERAYRCITYMEVFKDEEVNITFYDYICKDNVCRWDNKGKGDMIDMNKVKKNLFYEISVWYETDNCRSFVVVIPLGCKLED